MTKVHQMRRIAGLLASTLLAGAALTVAAAPAAQAYPTPSLTQTTMPSLLGLPVGGSAVVRLVLHNVGTITATHVRTQFVIQSNDSQRPQFAGFSSSKMTYTPPACPACLSAWTWSADTIKPGQSLELDIRVRAPGVVNDSELSYYTRADYLDELCDNRACLDAVRLRTPQPSTAYIASSRKGSAVYVNGLIKQRDPSGAIRSPGRTAYLQRQLGSGWQTMLSRPGDAMGQLAVGFVQNQVYRYRWVVAASPSGQPTVSPVSTR